ncbi:hypothetical protein [Flavobacterium suncheonense]|uniref:Uncharacterized protein n=1 Tax=Flavobacterium suncheonense GH29-5 = DSM 17707 TaxID=1121899 RepID=A0A0A2MMQ4_9FLAO|nr:hypothetical protein [Flavobacterium suncheonense]KGO89565.1 hypothetical protein Q764_07285 [Flavobacterium suncheonense GH29-5 = DSM 17707]
MKKITIGFLLATALFVWIWCFFACLFFASIVIDNEKKADAIGFTAFFFGISITYSVLYYYYFKSKFFSKSNA